MYAALLARRQAAAKLGGPNWEAKLGGGGDPDVMEVGGGGGVNPAVENSIVFPLKYILSAERKEKQFLIYNKIFYGENTFFQYARIKTCNIIDRQAGFTTACTGRSRTF